MVCMAKQPTKNKPMTIRLDKDLTRRLNEVADREKFRPTMTQVIETALREWLDRNAPAERPKR